MDNLTLYSLNYSDYVVGCYTIRIIVAELRCLRSIVIDAIYYVLLMGLMSAYCIGRHLVLFSLDGLLLSMALVVE